MKRIFIILTFMALAVPSTWGGISYYNISVDALHGSSVTLDLNQNGENDLMIRFGNPGGDLRGSDGPYELTPLGSTRIASSDGIATSFSTGDTVDLSLLSFIDNGSSTFAGGAAYDILGNFVAEGWGFTGFTDGNPVPPPEFFVDLFLVDLGSGIAWVDFAPPTNVFSRPIHWGYSDSTVPLSISAIPEPSATLLIGLGSLRLLFRRRRDTHS